MANKKSLLAQLQSRIAKRQNEIRELSDIRRQDIADGFQFTAAECQRIINDLAKDQKIDKDILNALAAAEVVARKSLSNR